MPGRILSYEDYEKTFLNVNEPPSLITSPCGTPRPSHSKNNSSSSDTLLRLVARSRKDHAVSLPLMERWAWRRPPKSSWKGGGAEGEGGYGSCFYGSSPLGGVHKATKCSTTSSSSSNCSSNCSSSNNFSITSSNSSNCSSSNCSSSRLRGDHDTTKFCNSAWFSGDHDTATVAKYCSDGGVVGHPRTGGVQNSGTRCHLRTERWCPGRLITTLVLLAVTGLVLVPEPVTSTYPSFHEATKMSGVRIPAGTEVDTIVYRIRASDAEKDYPLNFKVSGTIGKNLIYIKQHDCSRSNNIYCEADVYLRRELEPRRVYIFNLTVTDTRGDQTVVIARIDATDGYTPTNTIFLRYSPSVVIPEDMELQTDVTSLLVQKRSNSFVEFSLLGDSAQMFDISARLVATDEVLGLLKLKAVLDYETDNLHVIQVCAMFVRFREVRVARLC